MKRGNVERGDDKRRGECGKQEMKIESKESKPMQKNVNSKVSSRGYLNRR